LFNKRVVKAVGILIVVLLVYYSLFVVLPSEVDWAEVWADLQALSGWEIVALVCAGMLVIIALGWTSKASLPRLTLYQGTESSVTSQLTAFVFPPPGDMVIRFAMYRTYGFTDEESASAVLIAMIARYAMAAAMPLIGLAVVLVTGQGTWSEFWWFLGLGIAFVLVMWVIIRVAMSEKAAHATGRWLQHVVTRIWHWVRRTPPTDLEDSVVKFGGRIGGTLATNGRSLIASNFAWGFSNVFLMALALRFSGLTESLLSPASMVLATGLTMALNMLPIPGKDALATSTFAAVLGLTTTTEINDFGTGLLLYRLCTWILPMPVGAAAFFAWRYRVRRDEVTTVPDSDEQPARG
jgi:uncharacterized membrane protein YbhN (UPF0104 family)